MKPNPRPKYGWTTGEQAMHKIIRLIAEGISDTPYFSITADEAEQLMHDGIKQARQCQ